jgi:adenosyl cobinamide kinase/adenosyl cobinamide phosphate guanylyltransferase
MAVTTTQIRDLLNRPRGLTEGTISEYLTVRVNEVTKVARGSEYIASTSTALVSDALKDDAVKMLVCVDCLMILIDTYHSYASENDRGEQDRRFRSQLSAFQERADIALKMISEAVGSGYSDYKTTTRLTS